MSTAVLEIAKMLLGAYFSYARLNNATEEEIGAIYESEKDKFMKNEPSKLEDV